MNSILRLFRAERAQAPNRRAAERPADARREARGAARAHREDSGRAARLSPKGCPSTAGRLINTAVIALAQHLVVHFSEHDLASLAKTSTERAVADMKFGDRRDCDRMVERIREKIEELKQQKTFADQVKRRTDLLLDRGQVSQRDRCRAEHRIVCK